MVSPSKSWILEEVDHLNKEKEKLIEDIDCLETKVDNDSKFINFIKKDSEMDSTSNLIYKKFKEFFNQSDNKTFNQIKTDCLNSFFTQLKNMIMNKKKISLSKLDEKITIYTSLENPLFNDTNGLKNEKKILTKIKSIMDEEFSYFKGISFDRLLKHCVKDDEREEIIKGIKNFEIFIGKLNSRFKLTDQRIKELNGFEDPTSLSKEIDLKEKVLNPDKDYNADFQLIDTEENNSAGLIDEDLDDYEFISNEEKDLNEWDHINLEDFSLVDSKNLENIVNL